MFETLENILASRGEDAKAVVWAHNSHIGDATFTEMGVVREELTSTNSAANASGRTRP